MFPAAAALHISPRSWDKIPEELPTNPNPKGWQISLSKHGSLDFLYLDVDVYVYSLNAMYKIIHAELLQKIINLPYAIGCFARLPSPHLISTFSPVSALNVLKPYMCFAVT